jgi:hypothetical protein
MLGYLIPYSVVGAMPERTAPKCAIMKFEKEYEYSKAVFVGKVLNIRKDGNKKIFKFAVKKYWKGIESKTVVVAVNENPRFQAQFQIDGEYLVFAKDDEAGGLFDGRCSRSKDLEGFGQAVKEDLEKLGEAKTCIELRK